MNKMTCRPRLRRRLRRGENGLIFVAAIGLGLMVSSARGGSLDAPAGPNSPASAMWTLEDIYNVLNTHTTNVTKRTSFKEPTAGPTSGTMHNLNDIMTLAKRAPVPKTGATNTYWVGDDGTNRIGVAWPTQRFTAVASTGAETNQIRDNLTGLIWARNANIASNKTFDTFSSVKGTCTWYQAFNVITNSAGPVNGTLSSPTGYGGTNDWRLPNVMELHSLIAWQYSNPALCNTAGTAKWQEGVDLFTGVVSGNFYYWSSTTDADDTANAWSVNLGHGAVSSSTKVPAYYVWPVRGGR